MDLFAVSTLREGALRELARGGVLIFDCEGLERIDASVLQLLLAVERAAREQGSGLVLRAVPDNVLCYFDVAGADVLRARLEQAAAAHGTPDAASDQLVSAASAPIATRSAPPASGSLTGATPPEEQTS